MSDMKDRRHLSDASGFTFGVADDVSWTDYAWLVNDEMKSGCHPTSTDQTEFTTDRLFQIREYIRHTIQGFTLCKGDRFPYAPGSVFVSTTSILEHVAR